MGKGRGWAERKSEEDLATQSQEHKTKDRHDEKNLLPYEHGIRGQAAEVQGCPLPLLALTAPVERARCSLKLTGPVVPVPTLVLT